MYICRDHRVHCGLGLANELRHLIGSEFTKSVIVVIFAILGHIAPVNNVFVTVLYLLRAYHKRIVYCQIFQNLDDAWKRVGLYLLRNFKLNDIVRPIDVNKASDILLSKSQSLVGFQTPRKKIAKHLTTNGTFKKTTVQYCGVPPAVWLFQFERKKMPLFCYNTSTGPVLSTVIYWPASINFQLDYINHQILYVTCMVLLT